MASEFRKMYQARIKGRHPPFFGCFLQVAHCENNPSAPEPMYRLLRVIREEATFPKAKAFIGKRMAGHGNVIFVKYGEPALIAKSAALQTDRAYVDNRTAEIETEWLDAVRADEARHKKLLEYRKHDDDDGAAAMFAAHAAEHNARGWVKYMKAKAGFTDADVLEPGVRCEMPAEGDADGDFADEDAVDLHALPPKIAASDQKFAAVSVFVSNDDSMEAVVYLHDVLAEVGVECRDKVEATLNRIGMLCSPAPIDVVDVGVWNMPVANLWTLEPEEQSWNDGDLNEMQQQRLKDARKQDAEKAELLENERQTEFAAAELARSSGLDVDVVKTICATAGGCEALVAATKASTLGAREDAIEHCIETYGGKKATLPSANAQAAPGGAAAASQAAT